MRQNRANGPKPTSLLGAKSTREPRDDDVGEAIGRERARTNARNRGMTDIISSEVLYWRKAPIGPVYRHVD